MSQNSKNNFSWIMITLVFVVTIGAALLVISLLDSHNKKEIEISFDRDVERATTSIKSRIKIYINVLEGGQGLLATSKDISRQQWKAYIDALDIQDNYPGIQGVGYAKFISPEEKESHIESIRLEGFPDYTIRPEGIRDTYTSIVYLEPFDERNRQAFGFDMYQESNRRNAMDLARDTGVAHISRKITLVQEIDDDVQSGFLIYVPHYEINTNTSSTLERRQNILGYSYAPFRANDFIHGTLGTDGISGVALSVYDGSNVDIENQVYSDAKNKEINTSKSGLTTIKVIDIAGEKWTLEFNSEIDYGYIYSTRMISILVLLVAVLIGILLSVNIQTLSKSKAKAVAYANEVNKDLIKEKQAADSAAMQLVSKNKELEKRSNDIQKLNQMMVDREHKMIELKQKISESGSNNSNKDIG